MQNVSKYSPISRRLSVFRIKIWTVALLSTCCGICQKSVGTECRVTISCDSTRELLRKKHIQETDRLISTTEIYCNIFWRGEWITGKNNGSQLKGGDVNKTSESFFRELSSRRPKLQHLAAGGVLRCFSWRSCFEYLYSVNKFIGEFRDHCWQITHLCMHEILQKLGQGIVQANNLVLLYV